MSDKQSPGPEFNRRDFLVRGGSFATAMTLLGGVPLFAQEAPKTDKPGEEKSAGPKVKCAVIGLGAWGREIINTLLRVPQADIAAICDTYPAFLRRAGNLAPSAKPVEDYKAILADKEITAVILATPSHLHKEIAVAALKAGKHVYCEAPLATTLDEAREIAKAAQENFKLLFQPGLQNRSDPQRYFMLPFIRAGSLGKWVMTRAQWHKKQSWRATSPNPDREKAMNWRLDQATSVGLVGEIGIHQIDQVSWFLNGLPAAVTGFGSIMNWNDGRTVDDTVQAVFEFPNKVRLSYDASLATSFEGEYEVYYGSDATVLIREFKAWMFKEVDAPMIGWEVYAKKDQFFNETGISLKMGASKALPVTTEPTPDDLLRATPLYSALTAFVGNGVEIANAVEDFISAYGDSDVKGLKKNLADLKLRHAATWKEGYDATVLAIKANEAIVKNTKVEIPKDLFEI